MKDRDHANPITLPDIHEFSAKVERLRLAQMGRTDATGLMFKVRCSRLLTELNDMADALRPGGDTAADLAAATQSSYDSALAQAADTIKKATGK